MGIDLTEHAYPVSTFARPLVASRLATMRNKMSDARGTLYRPARHHAKLAVNSAKTLADFLFETLAYQKTKGKL